jgi:hypothetical protein
MPAKKMRVEVFDGNGNRYTITFEGQVTREKALRLLDIVELLGGMPGVNSEGVPPLSTSSKMNKILSLVEKHFPIIWFSSKDVQLMYEQELKEPITLSTVSTYLSRLAERGILSKSGSSNNWRYRVVTRVTHTALNVAKDK